MLVAFSKKDVRELKKQKQSANKKLNNEQLKLKPVKYGALVVMFISCYLIVVNGLYFIGDNAINSKNASIAKECFNINKVITIKDPDCYSKTAEAYVIESGTNKSSKIVYDVIENLKIANRLNPYDPRIIGNLAFINQQNGDAKEAIKYYDEFLKYEKFYPKIYSTYYKFLQQKYAETSDIFYKNKIDELGNIYKSNLAKLNSKSKYMKDQMTDKGFSY